MTRKRRTQVHRRFYRGTPSRGRIERLEQRMLLAAGFLDAETGNDVFRGKSGDVISIDLAATIGSTSVENLSLPFAHGQQLASQDVGESPQGDTGRLNVVPDLNIVDFARGQVTIDGAVRGFGGERLACAEIKS